MTVTREQAAYLAPIIAACRPHGARQWQHSEITAALTRLGHLGLPDVILAAVRCAQDRNAESPFAITNTRSPHWNERQGTAVAEPIEPFNRSTYCAVCGQPEARCRAVWTDDDHEFESVEQARARAARDRGADDHQAAADYARQALGDAKAEGPRRPEERAHKPSENVDRLRELVGASEEDA